MVNSTRSFLLSLSSLLFYLRRRHHHHGRRLQSPYSFLVLKGRERESLIAGGQLTFLVTSFDRVKWTNRHSSVDVVLLLPSLLRYSVASIQVECLCLPTWTDVTLFCSASRSDVFFLLWLVVLIGFADDVFHKWNKCFTSEYRADRAWCDQTHSRFPSTTWTLH